MLLEFDHNGPLTVFGGSFAFVPQDGGALPCQGDSDEIVFGGRQFARHVPDGDAFIINDRLRSADDEAEYKSDESGFQHVLIVQPCRAA
jgi:hypothetical protein